MGVGAQVTELRRRLALAQSKLQSQAKQSQENTSKTAKNLGPAIAKQINKQIVYCNGLKHSTGKPIRVELPNISGAAFAEWVGPETAQLARKGPKSYSIEVSPGRMSELCGVSDFGRSLRYGAYMSLCAPVKMTLQVR